MTKPRTWGNYSSTKMFFEDSLEFQKNVKFCKARVVMDVRLRWLEVELKVGKRYLKRLGLPKLKKIYS